MDAEIETLGIESEFENVSRSRHVCRRICKLVSVPRNLKRSSQESIATIGDIGEFDERIAFLIAVGPSLVRLLAIIREKTDEYT